MIKKLIVKVVRILDRDNIPYMIIGGQAFLLYGTVRLTEDIDITLGIDIDKLIQMKRLLRRMGLTIPNNIDDNFVKKTSVLIGLDKDTGIRVDFIFSFTFYERQALERVRKIKLNNYNVNFASCEDVIVLKLFAGRARDLEDVRILLEKNIEKLDVRYIRKWLKEFSEISKCNLIKEFERIIKSIR